MGVELDRRAHPPSDTLALTRARATRFARSPGPAPATSSLKRTQASITSARKVFRILKPLEMLMPIYQNPSLDWRKPLHVEVLKKLKCLCMALYFGMDHVVWMKQAGLIVKDIQSYQKASMLGWLGGSCWCVPSTLLVRSSDDSRPTTHSLRSFASTIWVELEELQLNLKKRYGETDEAYKERQAKEEKEMRKKALVLVHAVCQALLALGLLSLLRKDARKRWSPRTVGVFGVLASAVNCWMMYSEGGKEAIIEVLGLGNSRESRKKEL